MIFVASKIETFVTNQIEGTVGKSSGILKTIIIVDCFWNLSEFFLCILFCSDFSTCACIGHLARMQLLQIGKLSRQRKTLFESFTVANLPYRPCS